MNGEENKTQIWVVRTKDSQRLEKQKQKQKTKKKLLEDFIGEIDGNIVIIGNVNSPLTLPPCDTKGYARSTKGKLQRKNEIILKRNSNMQSLLEKDLFRNHETPPT